MTTDQLDAIDNLPANQGVLRVTCESTSDALAALRAEWNALENGIPFCRWEWLESWWRHFATKRDELALLLVRAENGELVGLAPWYLERSLATGRTLHALGSGMVCSDYVTILARQGCHEQIITALTQWLTGPGAQQWDAIDLEGVNRVDPLINALVDQLTARGHTIDRRGKLHCWRLPLSNNIDDLISVLGRNRRAQMRRLLRRQCDTGRAKLYIVRTTDELDQAFRILTDLHQRRRKSLGQPGCFATTQFESFLRESSERLLALGELRMEWVEIEGRPAAIEINFVGGGDIYCYQRGLDPELIGEQPGWLLTLMVLRRAIDEQFRSYDFLRGDEPYKANWSATAVPLENIHIAGQHASGRYRYLQWRSWQRCKLSAKAWLAKFARGGHGHNQSSAPSSSEEDSSEHADSRTKQSATGEPAVVG